MTTLTLITILILTAINAVFLLLLIIKAKTLLEEIAHGKEEDRKKTQELVILKGGDEDMALCYAYLIIKGLRTFESVPKLMQEQTKKYLIALEVEHLIPVEEEPAIEPGK